MQRPSSSKSGSQPSPTPGRWNHPAEGGAGGGHRSQEQASSVASGPPALMPRHAWPDSRGLGGGGGEGGGNAVSWVETSIPSFGLGQTNLALQVACTNNGGTTFSATQTQVVVTTRRFPGGLSQSWSVLGRGPTLGLEGKWEDAPPTPSTLPTD